MGQVKVSTKPTAPPKSLVCQVVTGKYRSSAYDEKLVRLGSQYGGWWVPKRILDKDNFQLTVISAGLGHDVTFDEEMLKAGSFLIGLDPLEECITFAKLRFESLQNYELLRKGMWTHSGVSKFFPPKNRDHDSWSTTNSQNVGEDEWVEFEVISFDDLVVNSSEW
jgi:hypothetical protein